MINLKSAVESAIFRAAERKDILVEILERQGRGECEDPQLVQVTIAVCILPLDHSAEIDETMESKGNFARVTATEYLRPRTPLTMPSDNVERFAEGE